MNQIETRDLLSPFRVAFEMLPSEEALGWGSDAREVEHRHEVEFRAAKFYAWLMEFLDSQLSCGDEASDARVSGEGRVMEMEGEVSDSIWEKKRKTVVLVGHGDFTALVMRRIMGFQLEDSRHDCAFVHNNTGITELEYFGNGRFLIMNSNQTPHLHSNSALRTGGTLKDGWSGFLQREEDVLQLKLYVAPDHQVEPDVKEQTEALKHLCISREKCNIDLDGEGRLNLKNDNPGFDRVAVLSEMVEVSNCSATDDILFVVKQGRHVMGFAWYEQDLGRIEGLFIRRTSKKEFIGISIVEAIKNYAKKMEVRKISVKSHSEEHRSFLEMLGFSFTYSKM